MQDEHSLDRQEQSSSGQLPAGESAVPNPFSMKGWRLLLWWLLLVVAALSGVAGVVSSVSTQVQDPASKVVDQYYKAIKNQDYATAFRFLGDANTDYFTFTQRGRQIDTTEGKVRDYSISSSSYDQRKAFTGNYPDPGQKYSYTVLTAEVTVSITRNGPTYSVDLQLQQQGEEWKIITLTGL